MEKFNRRQTGNQSKNWKCFQLFVKQLILIDRYISYFFNHFSFLNWKINLKIVIDHLKYLNGNLAFNPLANQWTGFCMIAASVMKGLNTVIAIENWRFKFFMPRKDGNFSPLNFKAITQMDTQIAICIDICWNISYYRSTLRKFSV